MIPSLLQIPSAVSDSKLHSVLPNNGKGDFTFDRSTGATRINRDGLIEEVGYFSSELVQNGDFSQLGSELAPAADFGTSDFVSSPASGTAVNSPNGTLTFTNSTSSGTQVQLKNRSVTTTKTYKIQFTITNYVAGTFRMSVGNQITASVSANGSYIFYVLYSGGLNRNYFYTTNSTLTVSNISVKQVDPNDRWTLESNWAYGSNKVIGSATTSEIQQDVDLPSGKVYKTTFTIEDYVSGDVRIRFRGGTTVNGTNRSGNGTYTEILTSTGHTNVKIDGGTSFTGSVTNISVVEVQGDRPRLSYDITNGVVEDKPHLLLEPSSTNLVVNSNASFITNKATITYNNINSPEGIQNAFKVECTSSGTAVFARTGDISFTDATFSLFVKYGNTQYLQFLTSNTGAHFFNFDVKNGVFGTNGVSTSNLKAVEYPNGWYRVSGYFIGGSGTGSFRVYPSNSNSATYGAASATSGDFLYSYGWQVEANSFATSYIPTAGTTITRAAETCNNSKPSVNSTEGVLYAETATLSNNTGAARILSLSDNTTNNSIRFEYRSTANQIRLRYRNGGASQNDFIHTLSNEEDFNKIAFKYKANDFSLYVNGTEVATLTSGSVVAANTFTTLKFLRADDSNTFYGKVKGLAVYNEALSESQLMQLTGVTASSIYSNFVTRTASFTVEALNEVKKVIDNL